MGFSLPSRRGLPSPELDVEILVRIAPWVFGCGPVDLRQTRRETLVHHVERLDFGRDARDVGNRPSDLGPIGEVVVEDDRDAGERGDDRHDNEQLYESQPTIVPRPPNDQATAAKEMRGVWEPRVAHRKAR